MVWRFVRAVFTCVYIHDFKPYHVAFRCLLIEVKYKLRVVQMASPLRLPSDLAILQQYEFKEDVVQ